MDELMILTKDLIPTLAKVFKEENSSQLVKRLKEDGSLEFYLGQRSVIEYLEQKLERSQTDMEV